MPQSTKGATTERQQVFQDQFRKTVICRFFLADACKKGSKCTFAHSVEEVQEIPDLRKTALCKLWKRGLCTLSADRCPFAHSRRELRMSPAFQEMSGRKRSGNGAAAAGASSDASTTSTQTPEGSEGSQSSGSAPASPRRGVEAGAATAAQPLAPGAVGRAQVQVQIPLPPGLKVDTVATTGGVQVPPPPPARPPVLDVPRQQPPPPRQRKGPSPKAAKETQLEPAFVQVPGLPGSPEMRPPLDGLLDISEKLLLGAPAPAFVSVSPTSARSPQAPGLLPPPGPPPPTDSRSTLALSECLAMEAQHRRAGPAPAAAAAAHQAAELRAIALEAEKKAAAYAQEAALLKLRAETAEMALAAAAARHPAPGLVRASTDGGCYAR